MKRVVSGEVMAVEFQTRKRKKRQTKNVKTLLSSGGGDACGSGFEGVVYFRKDGVPQFVTVGCFSLLVIT